MHVACHSSFDTNFRIQISTPTGQRNLKTQSPTQRPGDIQENILAASVPRTLEHLTNTFPPQVSQYPSPHHDTSFDPEWNFQAPTTPSACRPEAQGFNNLQFPDTWGLSTPSPDSPMLQDHLFLGEMQAAGPFASFTNLPFCFDSSTMHDSQHPSRDLGCEADSVWNSQEQQRTAAGWWVMGDTAYPDR